MSNELMNIVKILVVLFVCLFVYNTAFGKTMTMVVDGKELITITVSEDDADTEKKTEETEEEPDCE